MTPPAQHGEEGAAADQWTKQICQLDPRKELLDLLDQIGPRRCENPSDQGGDKQQQHQQQTRSHRCRQGVMPGPAPVLHHAINPARQQQGHGEQTDQHGAHQLKFHQHQEFQLETTGLSQAAAEGHQSEANSETSQHNGSTTALSVPFQLPKNGGQKAPHGFSDGCACFFRMMIRVRADASFLKILT